MRTILIAVLLLAGCGPVEPACSRYTRYAKQYEDCEASPKCLMTPDDYAYKRHWKQEAARFCS